MSPASMPLVSNPADRRSATSKPLPRNQRSVLQRLFEADGETSGSELASNGEALGRSSIYAALSALQRDGLVDARWRRVAGRRRRLVRINEAGLRRLLQNGPLDDTPRRFRHADVVPFPPRVISVRVTKLDRVRPRRAPARRMDPAPLIGPSLVTASIGAPRENETAPTGGLVQRIGTRLSRLAQIPARPARAAG